MQRLGRVISTVRGRCPTVCFRAGFRHPICLGRFMTTIIPRGMDRSISGTIHRDKLRIFICGPGSRSSEGRTIGLTSRVGNMQFQLTNKAKTFAPTYATDKRIFLSKSRQVTRLSQRTIFLTHGRRVPIGVVRSVNRISSPGMHTLVTNKGSVEK